jgi:hypothetical protein
MLKLRLDRLAGVSLEFAQGIQKLKTLSGGGRGRGF